MLAASASVRLDAPDAPARAPQRAISWHHPSEPRPTLIVDAENVRRSTWPNISKDELPALVESWSDEHDVDPLVVWEPPGETADEWIVREAPGYTPYWLVTSDRELRELAGSGAARVIGGGSFARELLSLRR